MVDFPDIPKPHIRKTLFANKSLYAPTHLHFLAEKERGPPFSYVPKRIAYRPSTKGKLRALEDAEFNRERAWLLQKLQPKEAPIVVQEDEENDNGIECGCCFSTYSFVMPTCASGFSVSSLTSSLLGQDHTVPRCTSVLLRMHELVR